MRPRRSTRSVFDGIPSRPAFDSVLGVFRLSVAVALAIVCLLGVPVAGQTPRVVQPGAPGEPTEILDAEALEGIELPGVTAADVRFMRGMIPHHAQALEMSALVADRTPDQEIHRLAQRIAISQRDEIALMERWLALNDRGDVAGPDRAGHAHAGHGPLMPGMLTPQQMADLRAASGIEFERLFLDLMIGHHEGALVMVRQLFATPGAGQESSIFTFASEVDADQQMEILRMRRMLDERR